MAPELLTCLRPSGVARRSSSVPGAKQLERLVASPRVARPRWGASAKAAGVASVRDLR